MSKIPVVILCGGRGIRLHEETEIRPKPLVEIGGHPILWHIMKHYAAYGRKDFVLCAGYKSEMIKDYFLNYHSRELDFTVTLGQGRPSHVLLHGAVDAKDWRVTIADTGQAAMTGARIAKAAKYVKEDTFMLTYGDGVSNVNLEKLLKFHRQNKKIATVTAVHPPSRFGELQIEGTNVFHFKEKPNDGSWINGGFFVFEREIFDYLNKSDDCVFEGKPLEMLARKGQLGVYVHHGFWQCMDTMRDLELLRKLWFSGKAPWQTWK